MVEKEKNVRIDYTVDYATPLLSWYDQNKRSLPWRDRVCAYGVWISEIMLQQTRVEAVKPYFLRFMEKLPGVQALADIQEDALLKLWEGLGYYSRARNLQKAAKMIQKDFGGQFPETYETLLKLPGIGSYTAGAIASIAYGEMVPAVDGNVLRVMSRLVANEEDILNGKIKKEWEEALLPVLPKKRAGEFNQALMDLGALICIPGKVPRCELCPMEALCIAKKRGIEGELPKKSPKKKRVIEEKTVLIIRDENRILMKKRPDKGLLAGLYEFINLPGKQEQSQVVAFLEEQGYIVLRIQKLSENKHIFSHVEWHMIGYDIRVDELDKPTILPVGTLRIEREDFENNIPLPTAFSYYNRNLWQETKKGKK